MCSGVVCSVRAMAGMAVVMIVVSSCSIAKPIATVRGMSRRRAGLRSTAKAGASDSRDTVIMGLA